MSQTTEPRPGPLPGVVFATLFAAVFLLVVISATLITFILPESFAGTAKIKIEPAPESVVPADSSTLAHRFLQTEAEVIRSEKILSRVVEQLNLAGVWGRKYANGERLKTAESVVLLKSRVTARPVRDTSMVEIRAFSDERDEAAKIANAIAGAYAAHTATGAGMANVEILESAHPALRPARPNKPVNLAIGVGVGLLAGLGGGGLGAWLTAVRLRRNRSLQPA